MRPWIQTISNEKQNTSDCSSFSLVPNKQTEIRHFLSFSTALVWYSSSVRFPLAAGGSVPKRLRTEVARRRERSATHSSEKRSWAAMKVASLISLSSHFSADIADVTRAVQWRKLALIESEIRRACTALSCPLKHAAQKIARLQENIWNGVLWTHDRRQINLKYEIEWRSKCAICLIAASDIDESNASAFRSLRDTRKQRKYFVCKSPIWIFANAIAVERRMWQSETKRRIPVINFNAIDYEAESGNICNQHFPLHRSDKDSSSGDQTNRSRICEQIESKEERNSGSKLEKRELALLTKMKCKYQSYIGSVADLESKVTRWVHVNEMWKRCRKEHWSKQFT